MSKLFDNIKSFQKAREQNKEKGIAHEENRFFRLVDLAHPFDLFRPVSCLAGIDHISSDRGGHRFRVDHASAKKSVCAHRSPFPLEFNLGACLGSLRRLVRHHINGDFEVSKKIPGDETCSCCMDLL
jgi:hypothetical protein